MSSYLLVASVVASICEDSPLYRIDTIKTKYHEYRTATHNIQSAVFYFRTHLYFVNRHSILNQFAGFLYVQDAFERRFSRD